MKRFLRTVFMILWPVIFYESLLLITALVFEGRIPCWEIISIGVSAAAGAAVFLWMMNRDRRMLMIEPETASTDAYLTWSITAVVLALVLNALISLSGLAELDTAAMEAMDEQVYVQPVLLQVLVAGVLGPLCEEALYRGIVFGRLKVSYGWVAGIIVSSLVFGISHFYLSQAVYALFMGLAFCYGYHKTGDFKVCCAMHISANTVCILLEYLLEI